MVRGTAAGAIRGLRLVSESSLHRRRISMHLVLQALRAEVLRVTLLRQDRVHLLRHPEAAPLRAVDAAAAVHAVEDVNILLIS